MSEELTVLKEYFEGLGFNKETLTKENVDQLSAELFDAGELGLAKFVSNLNSPEELLEYIGEE